MIKILFADDDLKYSMLLKSFLQQHGYDVTYAGNGMKAWEQFSEVKPDLVLLDINMPEMDGYEVAERIRAIDPKVLIFFLTDRTEKNDRLKGFSLKANDYLAKPFYPEELLARIEERFSMNESETIEEEVYHFGETTFCYNNNELRTRSSRVLITSRHPPSAGEEYRQCSKQGDDTGGGVGYRELCQLPGCECADDVSPPCSSA